MTLGPRTLFGFSELAQMPSDYGSSAFVSDLMMALAVHGVAELWLSGEPLRRLHLALGVIHQHAKKKADDLYRRGAREQAQASYRRIQFAVQPSVITGSFGAFWAYVALSGWVTRCDDGRYLLRLSQPHAEAMLGEYDWQYQRLLRASAGLIVCKLYGRSNHS